MQFYWATLAMLLLSTPAPAEKRLVIVDQDGSGPGGTNQMAMMLLAEAPEAEVLGITMVTGDAWRDEGVAHTLRMLELIGRTGIPVVPGAVFPLVRTQQSTRLAAAFAGKVTWMGAWGASGHGPFEIPTLAEGAPKTKALAEDAAHFLVRQVRAHPGEVTIYAAGPLTNIALALSIEPRFAELTRGIALMGGSLNPRTDDPEFASSPRHEFNFWFDPEAGHIVLRAAWPRIAVTTVDVSIQVKFTQRIIDLLAKSQSPAARYVVKYSRARSYMWDELAVGAWLDPSIITGERRLYMDVDLSHGPSYGHTLTWSEQLKPETGVRIVEAQTDVDVARFEKLFIDRMTGPAISRP